jgi:hypothetical protein
MGYAEYQGPDGTLAGAGLGSAVPGGGGIVPGGAAAMKNLGEGDEKGSDSWRSTRRKNVGRGPVVEPGQWVDNMLDG